MPQYVLLLHEGPEFMKGLSPEEMQKAIEKYMAWTKRPCHKGGIRLANDHGRVVRVENGKSRVADGPYSETKEVLGGYFIIEAANYDEAVKLALDHPHIEYNGTIEIRETWGERSM
jgi:hypothetical protein